MTDTLISQSLTLSTTEARVTNHMNRKRRNNYIRQRRFNLCHSYWPRDKGEWWWCKACFCCGWSGKLTYFCVFYCQQMPCWKQSHHCIGLFLNTLTSPSCLGHSCVVHVIIIVFEFCSCQHLSPSRHWLSNLCHPPSQVGGGIREYLPWRLCIDMSLVMWYILWYWGYGLIYLLGLWFYRQGSASCWSGGV